MKAVVKKQQTVDALVESFKGATAVYLLNFQGITVDKDNALRKALAAKGVKYHAVKNTLLKRVLEALKVEGLNDSLTGATSVMVGFEEDPLLPAREIEAFHKANPDFLVAKSIYLDGKAMPGSEVVNLSKIPDRKGMIAMIVSIALGPGSTIAGQLKTLQEKLEKESGSEAAPAAASEKHIMATDIKALGDQIVGLTLLEAKALADYLKETHGIEAAAGGAVVMAAAAAAPAEEKTEFDVILAEIDPAKKMAILKEVRAITGLGLAEAKKVVETANSVIKEAAPKADAEALKKKLEELGAKVTLK